VPCFLRAGTGINKIAMFPKFWYESNSCWGWVNSPEELAEKAQLQIEEPNGINTVDDFLGKSLRSANRDIPNFGTRIEHRYETLRTFLERENALDLFIETAKACNLK